MSTTKNDSKKTAGGGKSSSKIFAADIYLSRNPSTKHNREPKTLSKQSDDSANMNTDLTNSRTTGKQMNYQTKVNEKVSKKLQSLSHIPPNRKVGRTGSTGFVLPPMNKGIPEENRRSYTLVLDLDETLVHFD